MAPVLARWRFHTGEIDLWAARPLSPMPGDKSVEGILEGVGITAFKAGFLSLPGF
ncbi:MAG TPA: hypothetical protein VHO91_20750 [Rhodopila sp.]|nr:hypothetical protein [Rhodopila sp.]